VFVQANFGRRDELMIDGIYLGEEFADDNPMREAFKAPAGAGSIIAVVATDAPLFPSQCKAFARRVTSGLARTGTSGSHFSGDLFLALSTANPGAFTSGDPGDLSAATDARPYDQLTFIPWGNLDPFYEAVVQAAEEAVINSLVANEEMTGRDGHRSPALPRERLAALVAARDAAR
jgi:L-aminopeptidase/D-esterase-like protein